MKRLISTFVLAGFASMVPGAIAVSPEADASRLDPPTVVDADGKIVGRYVYSLGHEHHYPIALFDDAGTLTELTLINSPGSTLLTFHTASALYHVTNDCSGTTYIFGPTMGVRPGAVVALGHQSFLFYLADDEKRSAQTILSEGTQAACKQTNEYVRGLSIASSPPLDLNAMFRLPLHMH